MIQSTVALSLAGLSFLLTVIWGPPLLRVLRYFKVGEKIRLEGPQSHFAKTGTPTMGGVLFVFPVALITVLLNAVSLVGLTVLGRSILVPLVVMLTFAALGSVDDWAKLRGIVREGEGIRARTKFIFQVVFSLGVALVLRYALDVPELFLPGVPGALSLGVYYVPLAAFVIVGTSNAVNLTDGMDGLAGLISATAFAAYGGIALLQGQVYLARFCFTVVGALFGFLWFNVHPAELFMGDTGSLSLGATLGVVALMTGHWVLLPLIAVIPVAETLSVILQVIYFKRTGGKRLFKMAPLHHHYELVGWSETQIVQRFWLISLIAAILGVALALV